MEFLEKNFTDLELNSACDLLKSITPSEPFRSKDLLYTGQNEVYKDDFPGKLMRNGKYNSCTFENVTFDGTIGNSTRMTDCIIKDCFINNSNFIYSDFSNSCFNVNIKGGNFEYCDFFNTSFSNCDIKGTSFAGSYFHKANFSKTIIDSSNFSYSYLYYNKFSDLDLTSVSFNQAQFVHPQFDNVILPFFHILQISVGLEEILSQNNVCFKPVGSEYLVSTQEYINDIHMLMPIFFSENNFIAMANIYKYDGNQNLTKATILTGLRYAIEHLDFELLHSLCNFASLNSYFSPRILKEFYQYIEDNLDISKLSRVNYLKYINEIHLAKNILIDCPFDKTVMEIKLESTFDYKNISKLSQTINIINETLDEMSPDANTHISIRHNSPVELTIVLSDAYPAMLLGFAALGVIFMKGINVLDKIQKIIQNHQEIKSKKLDIKIKELELKEKEKKYNNNKSTILIPSDFNSLSYTLTNPKEIHKDLLRMRF